MFSKKLMEVKNTNNSSPDVLFSEVSNLTLAQMSSSDKFMKVKDIKDYSLRLTCN